MPTCQCCGDHATERYRLALEWPAEEPRDDEPVTFDDPGAGELLACADCADRIATNVLINRADVRGLEDVYAGLEPEESAATSATQASGD